mmetsp:Transcript_21181/g.41216  ORF Transcript_21181/g.41216 Transcript_21181/m.41216 type:complete len:204 (+) Transcript_21181:279-890(+)
MCLLHRRQILRALVPHQEHLRYSERGDDDWHGWLCYLCKALRRGCLYNGRSMHRSLLQPCREPSIYTFQSHKCCHGLRSQRTRNITVVHRLPLHYDGCPQLQGPLQHHLPSMYQGLCCGCMHYISMEGNVRQRWRQPPEVLRDKHDDHGWRVSHLRVPPWLHAHGVCADCQPPLDVGGVVGLIKTESMSGLSLEMSCVLYLID